MVSLMITGHYSCFCCRQWHIDAQANPGSTVNETNLQKKLVSQ